MAGRQYSEREEAEALAVLDLNEGNISATARATKIPASTIRLWRDNRDSGNLHGDLTIKCEDKKRELAELFEDVARVYIEQALKTVSVTGTKGKDAVTAAAIATDKNQLLLNRPTSIIAQTISDSERADRAAAILTRGKLRLVDNAA